MLSGLHQGPVKQQSRPPGRPWGESPYWSWDLVGRVVRQGCDTVTAMLTSSCNPEFAITAGGGRRPSYGNRDGVASCRRRRTGSHDELGPALAAQPLETSTPPSKARAAPVAASRASAPVMTG